MWKNQIASLFLGAVLSGALGVTGCASSNPTYGMQGADGGPDTTDDPPDLSLPTVMPDLTITMCQLTPQLGCPAGYKCTTHDAVTTVCDPDGNTNRGERCTSRENVDTCFAGNVCTAAGPGVGICRAFCRTDSDCGGRSYCELPLGTMGQRVCSLPCNALGQTAGCPMATSCYAYGREHTDCRLTGQKAPGQPCARPEECQPGSACLGPAGGETCTVLCRRNTTADCPSGKVCANIQNSDTTFWATYGACL